MSSSPADRLPGGGAAPALREAWSGDSPLRAAAKARLLDATSRCIVRDGALSVSIASVAQEAGVSRPTVYRYFKDRSALVRTALLRGGTALTEALHDHLRAIPGAAAKAVEANLFVLEAVAGDPLLSEAWRASVIDAEVLADFTTTEAVTLARRGLSPLVDEAGWNDDEADEAVEFMLRILLTLLVAPGGRQAPADVRRLLERWVVPGLGLPDERNTRRAPATDARTQDT